jgi:hypothetical protein
VVPAFGFPSLETRPSPSQRPRRTKATTARPPRALEFRSDGGARDLILSGISQGKYEAALEAIGPHVSRTLERAPRGTRFSTFQFIKAFRQDAEADSAYQRALDLLADNAGWSHAAAQVLHGQVIPELLRVSPGLHFAGFAHDAPAEERDGTHVPSYWRKE